MVDSPAASEQDGAALVTGTIKWFDESKGYGFVVRDDSRDDIFCHINQVAEECDFPKEGDRVSFVEGTGRDGRPFARRVTITSVPNGA